MSRGLELYLDFMVFVFGAVIGSFLNVCIYRMPRNESLVTPPSHCPQCGKDIRWFDNIPIVSYVVLRGRCRNCAQSFSPRYALVELVTGLLFLMVWLRYGPPLAPIYWVLLAGLVVATFIDFEHFIIPNEITYGGAVFGVILSALWPTVQHTASRLYATGQSVLGLLVGGLTLLTVVELGKLFLGRLKMKLPSETAIRIADQKLVVDADELLWEEIFNRESDRIRFQAALLKFGEQTFENVAVEISDTTLTVNGQAFALTEIGAIEGTTDLLIIPREAMGLGDVKLLAAIGAFLGWQGALFCVVASSMVGAVVGLALMILNPKGRQNLIPYGPYIALGAVLWIFWGQTLVDRYMSLIQG